MIIRVDDIKEHGLTLETTDGAELFPVLSQMQEGEEVRFSAPVHVWVRAIRVREMIEVEGRIETALRLGCSRCLNEFEMPMMVPFALTFVRELPEVADEDGAEVELSAEEMGLIAFEGDEIDLRPALEEQVVMAFPVRPLCREACKGLCPQCGADLNKQDCGCIRPVFNQKFASLKAFRVERDEKKGK